MQRSRSGLHCRHLQGGATADAADPHSFGSLTPHRRLRISFSQKLACPARKILNASTLSKDLLRRTRRLPPTAIATNTAASGAMTTTIATVAARTRIADAMTGVIALAGRRVRAAMAGTMTMGDRAMADTRAAAAATTTTRGLHRLGLIAIHGRQRRSQSRLAWRFAAACRSARRGWENRR